MTKLFKKLISISSALAILMTCSVMMASASDSEFKPQNEYDYVHEGVEKPTKEDIEKTYVFENFTPENNDFLSYEMVTMATVRSVAVTEPCDKSWRDKYPTSWMWEANRTIQAADDMLTSRYGIQFYSVSQKYWESDNTTNPESLVREAHREWGLRDGAKLMIAFTNRILSTPYGNIYGLVEDIGKPYVLVTCYGFDENAMTVRHEVGHAYKLTHCSRTTNCVMAEAATRSKYNSICSQHNSDWNKYKTLY